MRTKEEALRMGRTSVLRQQRGPRGVTRVSRGPTSRFRRGASSPDVCEVLGIHPEAIQRARQGLPSVDEARRIAERFALLADPTRLRILHALAREELCVCDVAQVVSLSISAASHQLRLLHRSGAVTYRKEGRMAYYRLADDTIRRWLREEALHDG